MNTIKKATTLLINNGLSQKLIDNEKVRVPSILYMVYWIERLKNNQEEQSQVKSNLSQYLGRASVNSVNLLANNYEQLVQLSQKYVKEELQPVQTVDLVIEKDKKVLLFDRAKFPKGVSLPGGLVEDSDEDNILNIEQKTFTALRVAAEKVLYLDKSDRLYEVSPSGEYSVSNKSGTKKITIHPQSIYGYSIKENIHAVLRASDPRHLVDTIGFKCSIVDSDDKSKEYFWESKDNLLSNHLEHNNNNFAFNHHKEIIFHTLAKTSVEQEMQFNEKKFIRDIIDNPIESYQNMSERLKGKDTSFPELFPTVNKILTDLFSDDINEMCKKNEVLIGFRDKVVNSLRHVSLKNRTFCPYVPTVNAIFNSIAFFDVVAREKKQFYKDLSATEVLEHNPKEKENAPYHMYKYEYRMWELMAKVPDEIIIPTFAPLSATDLMKVRGVPIRFVGLSKDFIYVDEFEQSPQEFLMHDVNHSYRMSEEDDRYKEENNISPQELLMEQNKLLKEYLPSIKISESDSEREKEMKKIKKIILFEIFHEDARPALAPVILDALIKKEGGEAKFELPIIDEKTHFMDIVDVLDTHISTLSYVRNKLQCGFYDKVDKQNSQIVKPEYRKSDFIAQAAFDMVCELSLMYNKKIDVDYEYLLKRVCSVGPNNIYNPVQEDENVAKYSDGASYLNPKRYQSNEHKKNRPH